MPLSSSLDELGQWVGSSGVILSLSDSVSDSDGGSAGSGASRLLFFGPLYAALAGRLHAAHTCSVIVCAGSGSEV